MGPVWLVPLFHPEPFRFFLTLCPRLLSLSLSLPPPLLPSIKSLKVGPVRLELLRLHLVPENNERLTLPSDPLAARVLDIASLQLCMFGDFPATTLWIRPPTFVITFLPDTLFIWYVCSRISSLLERYSKASHGSPRGTIACLKHIAKPTRCPQTFRNVSCDLYTPFILYCLSFFSCRQLNSRTSTLYHCD